MSQVLSAGVTSLQVTLNPRIPNSDFSDYYPQPVDQVLDPNHLWLVPEYVYKMQNSTKYMFRRLLVCAFVCCSNTKRFLLRNNSLIHTKYVILENCDVDYSGQFIVKNCLNTTLDRIIEELNLVNPISAYNGFILDNTKESLKDNLNVFYKLQVSTESGTPQDATWISPEDLVPLLPTLDEFSQLIPTLALKV